MDTRVFQCLRCGGQRWAVFHTLWRCEQCAHDYGCVGGVPRLLIEERVSREDRSLRDYFYNGLLGRFYQVVMPFLTLPARPWKIAWKDWLVYGLVVTGLLTIYGRVAYSLASGGWRSPSFLDVGALAAAVATAVFFARHPYLLQLLLLAVPVKLSLCRSRFRPHRSFGDVHAEWVDRFLELSRTRGEKLRVLDISTGTCNSLFRHGWMKLDADYAGLDLSETMLAQGLRFMADRGVAMSFAIGDAQALPFASESFDIVLNYGALNGYGDAGRALREMARVARPGGLVLFLDEQLYDRATVPERMYFRAVLSSHNVIHRCPTELMPPELADVTVHQIYEFYYLCTSIKRPIPEGPRDATGCSPPDVGLAS